MPFDGTQLNETAAHLMRAKRYIEEHGWRQHHWGDGTSPRCLLGAVHATMPDGRHDLYAAAVDRLMSIVGQRPHVWNDTPGRTVEEVYAAFDRAIALAMETPDA